VNIRAVQNGETLAVAGVEELHSANWRSVVSDIRRLFYSYNVRHIEVDLSEVTYFDNHGLGSLIALSRLAQMREGRLRVKNPSLPVRSLLELTRMHYLIAIDSPAKERSGPAVSTNRVPPPL
jgi:anti-anti-sigma factor